MLLTRTKNDGRLRWRRACAHRQATNSQATVHRCDFPACRCTHAGRLLSQVVSLSLVEPESPERQLSATSGERHAGRDFLDTIATVAFKRGERMARTGTCAALCSCDPATSMSRFDVRTLPRCPGSLGAARQPDVGMKVVRRPSPAQRSKTEIQLRRQPEFIM
jgi:hypothetical protein